MSEDYGLNVTAEDIAAVREVCGKFTNRIFVQIDGYHLRINLGEYVSGKPRYHTAAVVPIYEALGFAQLIQEMAERGISQLASPPVSGDGE